MEPLQDDFRPQQRLLKGLTEDLIIPWSQLRFLPERQISGILGAAGQPPAKTLVSYQGPMWM